MSTSNSKFRIQNSKLPAYAGFVRWAFARFYREFAWTYDAVAAAVSGGQWFDWARVALPHLRGRVLELGCGTGHMQLALAERGATGLDASPQMLKMTQQRLDGNGYSPRLVRAIAQALPFPGASFDSILATFPTEYIVDPCTLQEVRRVLCPNGRLVVVLGATFAAGGLYERAIDFAYRVTLQQSPRATPPPQSATARVLSALGFDVSESWEPVGMNQVHLIRADLL